jgi:hypothetical protein
MWRNGKNRLSLQGVRWLLSLLVLAAPIGCRVLTSGLPGQGAIADNQDARATADVSDMLRGADSQAAIDLGEPPGVSNAPDIVGCSDGSREGFRDLANYPNIAGCAGAFDQPGVVGPADLRPACGLLAGDTNSNRSGTGCNAADLCAAQWHVCRNGDDVAHHSPTGDCEGCVPAGEPRFFLVASGASPMGICTPDPQEMNDLHGCGGLGQPETQDCAPLSRRMGFADCLATGGVWMCGGQADSLREAKLVKKAGTTLGGALCCRD